MLIAAFNSETSIQRAHLVLDKAQLDHVLMVSLKGGLVRNPGRVRFDVKPNPLAVRYGMAEAEGVAFAFRQLLRKWGWPIGFEWARNKTDWLRRDFHNGDPSGRLRPT